MSSSQSNYPQRILGQEAFWNSMCITVSVNLIIFYFPA